MEIIISNRAVKTLFKMNDPHKKRIINAIHALPNGNIKKLAGMTNAYRLRVGDWRILFDIVNEKIEITDILPRGSAYK